MPSSPDLAARARPWHPVQLIPAAAPAVPTPSFHADRPDVPALQPFRVSGPAGVPDQVLEPARAAARAAGYAEGWTAGLREARLAAEERAHADLAAAERAAADREARRRRAFRTIDEAAAELERRAVPAAHEIEQQIISAAFEIAEGLVGRVLRDDEVRGPAALARALSLAPADAEVTVAVSPADFRMLTAGGVGGVHAAPTEESVHPRVADGTAVPIDGSPTGESAGADGALAADGTATFTRQLVGRRTVTIAMDTSLAPGDAIATCGATRVDARLSAGLARVREVLAR